MEEKQTIEELQKKLELVVLNEDARRTIITHHLKSPLNIINVNVERMLYDLKENERKMQKLREAHPHNEEIQKATTELAFQIRRYTTLIQTGVQLGSDIIEGIASESASKEELQKGWQKTKPIKRTGKIIEAHNHLIISRNLGLSFQYNKNDSEKYVFEIENMVNRPINVKDVLRKIRDGYTAEEIEDRAFFESNQGIGLESVINILGKLGGEYELSSGDSFRLREEDSKGMKRKTYGIITPEQHVPPLPSFYFKASIPIKE